MATPMFEEVGSDKLIGKGWAPSIADPLTGRRIVLGVTGSIAAYKALEVASRLVRSGAEVDVIMTRAATELVQRLAFQAITHRSVSSNLWSPADSLGMDHIRFAREAALMLIVPATADTIARLALGRADDALTTTALALDGPLVIAPAMEPRMWAHPATQANAATLSARGAVILGPATGRLASGKVGTGRMVEPAAVIDAVRRTLAQGGMLKGLKLVISGGPTREAIDPVRFLSNRSTGRMGVALAEAARDAGAEVILVLGPCDHPALSGVRVIDVESAESMAVAVLDSSLDADAIIMSAAVADFRPVASSSVKIKKADSDGMAIDLERTRDILLAVAERADHLAPGVRRPLVVGFAAETGDPEPEARRKLAMKQLDFIVANRVPAAFGDVETDALLIAAEGDSLPLRGTKREVAGRIVGAIGSALVAHG